MNAPAAAPTTALIGIDVGTTRLKALLLDLTGRELALAERTTGWQASPDGTELDPVELAAAGRAVATEAAAAAERLGYRVAAVGVTGMGESGVLVDARHRPLHPVIAWHDPRGDHDRIEDRIGRDSFEQGTGMPLDAQPSISKILWLRRTRPECAQAVRFHSVPEWIVLALGGEPVSELSLASRTGLLALADCRPWQPATELIGRNLLGRTIVAGEPAGRVSPTAAAGALGDAVLTVAGHDHQSAALATGAARDGTMLDSFGTAEALVRCVGAPIDPHAVGRLTRQGVTVGWGVLPGHRTVMFGLRTGMALEQLANRLGALDRASRHDLGLAAAGATALPDGVDVLHFTEHGVGLRLPEELTPDQVWALAVRQCADLARVGVDLVEAEVGRHTEVVLAGGWMRDPAVLAAKRDRYGSTLTSGLTEAGAVGAGLLGGVAAGLIDRHTPPQAKEGR